MSYGDVLVRDQGPGCGVDVAVDLGNGKFAKVFTDPNGTYSFNGKSLNATASTLVWSKP